MRSCEHACQLSFPALLGVVACFIFRRVCIYLFSFFLFAFFNFPTCPPSQSPISPTLFSSSLSLYHCHYHYQSTSQSHIHILFILPAFLLIFKGTHTTPHKTQKSKQLPQQQHPVTNSERPTKDEEKTTSIISFIIVSAPASGDPGYDLCLAIEA